VASDIERAQAEMFVSYVTDGGLGPEELIRARLAELREEHLATGKPVLQLIAEKTGGASAHGG